VRSFALAILTAGLLLAVSSCNLLLPIDCTLIGCSDALSVEITDPGSERYQVVLLVEGEEVATREVDCAGPSGCRAYFEETPAEVTIRIEAADGTAVEHEVRPTYEPQYPNGRRCDCEPVCHQASVALGAPDAVG